MTLLTTGASHQNPLIRRVRRHGSIAMLFRTALPEPTLGQRAPEPFILGQAQRVRANPDQSLMPPEINFVQPNMEATPLTTQESHDDAPEWMPIAPNLIDPAEWIATSEPKTAPIQRMPTAQPNVDHIPASVARPTWRALDQPTVAQLPGQRLQAATTAAAAQPAASVMAEPEFKVAGAFADNPVQTNWGAVAPTDVKPSTLPPVVASTTLPTQAVATPAAPSVQRQPAAQPSSDGIDAPTWNRLQAAYNRYREREATGDLPQSAAGVAGTATTQPLFARRATAPRPAARPQSTLPVVQRYPHSPQDERHQPTVLPGVATDAGGGESVTSNTGGDALEQLQPVAIPRLVPTAPSPQPSLAPRSGSAPTVENNLPTIAMLPKPTTAQATVTKVKPVAQRDELPPAVEASESYTAAAQRSSILSLDVAIGSQAGMASTVPVQTDPTPSNESFTEVVLTGAVPLQDAWPVQHTNQPISIAQGRVPSSVQPMPDEPPLLDQGMGRVEEAALPLAPQVQRRLAAPQTARPTESKVDIVMPRRPRPTLSRIAQVPSLQPVTRQTETPSGITDVDQPASDDLPSQTAATMMMDQPDSPMIATEIGPLPADLWTLVGVEPPRQASAHHSSPVVARSMAAPESAQVPPTGAAIPVADAIAFEPLSGDTAQGHLPFSEPRQESSASLSMIAAPTSSFSSVDRLPADRQLAPISEDDQTSASGLTPPAPKVDAWRKSDANVHGIEQVTTTPEAATATVASDIAGLKPISSPLQRKPADRDVATPKRDDHTMTANKPMHTRLSSAMIRETTPPNGALLKDLLIQRQSDPAEPLASTETSVVSNAAAEDAADKKKRQKPSTPTKSRAKSIKRSDAN